MSTSLNPKYTFESFVVFADAAARAVAAIPSKSYALAPLAYRSAGRECVPPWSKRVPSLLLALPPKWWWLNSLTGHEMAVI